MAVEAAGRARHGTAGSADAGADLSATARERVPGNLMPRRLNLPVAAPSMTGE
jgi:hypothetical protein